MAVPGAAMAAGTACGSRSATSTPVCTAGTVTRVRSGAISTTE